MPYYIQRIDQPESTVFTSELIQAPEFLTEQYPELEAELKDAFVSFTETLPDDIELDSVTLFTIQMIANQVQALTEQNNALTERGKAQT